MVQQDTPPSPPVLQTALQQGIVRMFYGAVTLIGLLGLIVAPLLGGPLSTTVRWTMALGYGTLAILAALGSRLSPTLRVRLMGLLIAAGMLLVGGLGVMTGWGLQIPGLSFFAATVCVAYVAGERRQGLASTLLALGVMLALAAAERGGWLAAPMNTPPLPSRLVLQCAAVLACAVVGHAAAVLLQQHLAAAEAREQRFLTLLGIATSAYWETDADLRLMHARARDASGQFMPLPAVLGHLPWQLPPGPDAAAHRPSAPLTDADAARLQAAMATRLPLRDMALQWHGADGSLRQFLVSGEPRSAAQGRFIGYWGVAREVTAEHEAARALARSQALLAQVVSLSPDIIVLTELPSGRYVMVNQSFTRLLGYETTELVGRSALELGLWRDPADRLRVGQAVAAHGSVHDLPIDFVSRSGQVVPVMMSCTSFDSDGRAYMLSNARDMSETHRVRLEREAILANASVGIAFTRERRFELANAQFEAMFGWPPGQLVGQPGRAVFASDADYEAVGRVIGPRLAQGESVDIERLGTRRDGSSFLVRLRAKAIDPKRPTDSGTIWIAEDVTDARQAAQELARARDAAEAANQAKSAFLANTSHEIRTPLNGLTGLARLARQPGVPPERLHHYLDQIGESADLLSTIISDILDVAKIEAGKLDLEDAPFDLGQLLQTLVRAHGALAGSHGLAFAADVGPALPAWVRGDALRVRQILANFLHNALKFTSSGGIRLVVRSLAGGVLRFEVHDTGPGIAADVQARLFKPFTQADESTTRRFGGTGLGLSICRELATLMGGQVGLTSTPGRGSCFHAELPLPAVPTPGSEAASTDAAAGARLRGMRVLLVEDNSVNMMISVALLEEWDVQVTEAVDGHQALAAVARAAAAGAPFDLVLMDLQMPGISGYETTARLRQAHGAAELPVIALTAAALVSERERALASGMNEFLTKPIDPDRLRLALLRMARSRPVGVPGGGPGGAPTAQA